MWQTKHEKGTDLIYTHPYKSKVYVLVTTCLQLHCYENLGRNPGPIKVSGKTVIDFNGGQNFNHNIQYFEQVL